MAGPISEPVQRIASDHADQLAKVAVGASAGLFGLTWTDVSMIVQLLGGLGALFAGTAAGLYWIGKNRRERNEAERRRKRD